MANKNGAIFDTDKSCTSIISQDYNIVNMNTQNGYVKIYRSILEWEWFTDVNTCQLFLYCLLKANHKDNRYKGILIKRGQFLTSLNSLSEDTGLTISNIRTSLKKLILTQELTQASQSRYSIITVNNYDEYQENSMNFDKQIACKSQANDMLLTTNNNDKNDKNEKNDNIYFSEKNKIDPFINPIKDYFCKEYLKIFNNKARLSNQMSLRLIELNSEIEDFKETIPIVLNKLKNIKFTYSDNSTHKPSLTWLLTGDNYFKVLEGQFDKQENDSEKFYREMKAREQIGEI